MPAGPEVQAHDGVAVSVRGDVCLIVYQRAARLERTRWLFDRIDDAVASAGADMVALMIVLPTADPPDAPTRAENTRRLRKIGAGLRRLVTTPVGDALSVSVVRAIMRGLAILNGNARGHFVCDTVQAGIARVLEVATERTPSAQLLTADLLVLHRALDADASYFAPPAAR